MSTIAKIFRRYAPAYLDEYGDRLPAEHRKVIKSILECRTPSAGVAVYGCNSCPEKRIAYLGCGNRHCPNCQQDKSRQWLNRALEQVLPGPHFFVTFTVPQELRRFIRSNQRLAYGALFKATSEALKVSLANKKYCGADHPGFFGVLHTWTRQLEYHPHVHFVVPGGGLDRDSKLWQSTGSKYLVPGSVLSALFKKHFRALMKTAGLFDKVPTVAWSKKWVVDVQAVGNNTEGILKYLAPYVFRVAISDSRIVSDENGLITIKYSPSGSKETKLLPLRAFEFMRRFLQHVLPTGFMKIRYYGFMSPASTQTREAVAAMVCLADAESPILVPPSPPKPEPLAIPQAHLCECCQKPMVLLQVWKRNRVVYEPTPLLTAAANRQ